VELQSSVLVVVELDEELDEVVVMPPLPPLPPVPLELLVLPPSPPLLETSEPHDQADNATTPVIPMTSARFFMFVSPRPLGASVPAAHDRTSAAGGAPVAGYG